VVDGFFVVDGFYILCYTVELVFVRFITNILPRWGEEELMKISHDVRCVIVQFSFSNRSAVPACLPEISKEDWTQYQLRLAINQQADGQLVIPHTERCSLEGVMEDMQDLGFVLGNAFFQERRNQNKGPKTFWLCRFVYLRKEDVLEIPFWQCEWAEALKTLLSDNFWAIKLFDNPVEGTSRRMLSLNMSARVPRYHGNGEPVLARPKDEHGRLLSNEPIPIVSDFDLFMG